MFAGEGRKRKGEKKERKRRAKEARVSFQEAKEKERGHLKTERRTDESSSLVTR
jgi:hypothetical protein